MLQFQRISEVSDLIIWKLCEQVPEAAMVLVEHKQAGGRRK